MGCLLLGGRVMVGFCCLGVVIWRVVVGCRMLR